eukprot:gene9731-20241_t
MRRLEYLKLATEDNCTVNELNDLNGDDYLDSSVDTFNDSPDQTGLKNSNLRNSKSVPISRPPAKGSFLGIVFIILMTSSEFLRTSFLRVSIQFAITIQILMGIIIILEGGLWKWLGVYYLASSTIYLMSFKHAQDTLIFSSALIEMIIDIQKKFGSSLVICCFCITVVHTCLLLLWAAVFIAYIAEASEVQEIIVATVLVMSLHWVSQFFHALMSTVVGGCIIYYFARDDFPSSGNTAAVRIVHDSIVMDTFDVTAAAAEEVERLVPQRTDKVLLYAQCGFTSSLGSVNKAALLSPPAQIVLNLLHWTRVDARRGGSGQSWSWTRSMVFWVCGWMEGHAQRHSRLALSSVSAYGNTLCRAGHDLSSLHPEVFSLQQEDATGVLLRAVVTSASCVIAVLLALLAEKKEGAAWPSFLILCFYLSGTSLSLPLHVFRGSVDALIVAYSNHQERFANTNPLVFQRFFRMAEMASPAVASMT